jgi:ribosome-binding factor A
VRKRNPRLDHAVAEAIADLLATEFNDPRLRMVSITEAQVSQDAREAIVFWSVPDREVLSDQARTGASRDLPLPEDAAAALASARARLQKLLSNRVRMMNTPVLRFEQDPVRQQADRVEELLRDVRRDRD